ncbi:alpha/beta fold hydrolase [Tenacibaculum larymnensis]|uniref:Alpha/beta hydrolase n=1 Tax=Tenacibaculum larymnensis TaxID=2878201 RepID=A0A9X4EPP5_9FLAO|nr:alpha/beta hydrolase [Tenacibaculum larymnensis]MDE1207853.1 alpha/beta hydrolase [Tenacibaculum larymnensis]
MKQLGLALIFILTSTIVLAQNPKKSMKKLLSAYEFKTRCVKVDDIEMTYLKEGKGDKTLLFLHGLSSNADAWFKNIETLKENYTCVAIDLPGHGKSSKPEEAYTPTFFADVVFKFIKKKRLKNVILVGHSMGGQASMKLVLMHPEVIEKLVLIAPAGLEQFSEAQGNILKSVYTAKVVKNTTDDQITKNYALNFYEQPKEVSKMIEDRIRIKQASDFNAHCEAIVKSVYGMLDDPVHKDLEKISQKTLVVFGNKDMLIPNRYLHPELTIQDVGNIAVDKIKNVTVKYVENCGHFAQFEKPEKVNLLIQEFVESD